MKQFAVIGLGTFGASIARSLFQMDQEVLAIDSDAEAVDDIKDDVTQAIQADMDNEEVLRSLGLNNFDAVIVAIGKDIQTSILVSLLCKDIGVQCLVARARNDLHAKVLAKIGVDKVIFPERDTGARLAHSLVSSNILDVIELSDAYSLVSLAVPQVWSGKTLKELNMRVIYGITAIAVEDSHGKTEISPGPNRKLMLGESVTVVGSNENIQNLEALLETQAKPARLS